jgi:hypothetical protein
MMKIRHICLITLCVALVAMMATPVMACRCRRPGKSPGWWKHQFKAHFEDKGKPHVSWGQLGFWADEIDEFMGEDPPWFFGYPLPRVTDLDYDEDGEFTRGDAYNIFTDTDWNHMWTPLANWFNKVSGRRPYWG